MSSRTGALLFVLLLAAAIAGYLLLNRVAEPPAIEPAAVAAAPAAAPEAVTPPVVTPVIAHPLADLPADAALPAAEHADAALIKALGKVLSKRLLALIVPDELLRRVVATVDNLPRKQLPASLVPLKRAPGIFATSGSGDALSIDPSNSQRYTSHVQLIVAVDAGALVALYRRFYPLFQQTYAQLGYPGAYFNDGLVAAIDDLLAAPEIDAPIALTQPKVLYEFADAKLQALSAGQKIMIRVGRANAASIKAKLREIRALVAGVH